MIFSNHFSTPFAQLVTVSMNVTSKKAVCRPEGDDGVYFECDPGIEYCIKSVVGECWEIFYCKNLIVRFPLHLSFHQRTIFPTEASRRWRPPGDAVTGQMSLWTDSLGHWIWRRMWVRRGVQGGPKRHSPVAANTHAWKKKSANSSEPRTAGFSRPN